MTVRPVRRLLVGAVVGIPLAWLVQRLDGGMPPGWWLAG